MSFLLLSTKYLSTLKKIMKYFSEDLSLSYHRGASQTDKMKRNEDEVKIVSLKMSFSFFKML